jgi:UDP-N-acetylglucosamine:LPS N-acetylglucosamine transferase
MFYKEGMKNFVRNESVYLVVNPERSPFRFLIHFAQVAKIFFKERPDIIISTGAGVAVGMCYLSWMFGKKVIFIEDWCNINAPSLTGRLVYSISSLFIIQHITMQQYYPKAVYGGSIL